MRARKNQYQLAMFAGDGSVTREAQIEKKPAGHEQESTSPDVMATPEQAMSRMAALRYKLQLNAALYYGAQQPAITDAEYDEVMQELIGWEQRFPGLIDPDSPTQRVGGVVDSQFGKVEHVTPMLSLDNAFDEDAVRAWYDRMSRELGRQPMITAEVKIDGLAFKAVYINGRLTQGATRGDGQTGEDVTHNVRTVRNLPLQAATACPSEFEIRGEIYLPKDEFERVNRERAEAGDYEYANPRNAAAGTMRQLDPAIAHQRHLMAWVYSLNTDNAAEWLETQWERLAQLRQWGFPTNSLTRRCKDVEEISAFHSEMVRTRDDWPYEGDGVVLKVDDMAGQDELGATGHAPVWAIAWKFPAERATATLLDIETSIGRFGTITPVARLAPVKVGGVTVQSATLHNAAYLRERDIRVGDEVYLERAGDVIPKVLGPVDSDSDRATPEFEMPSVCPACDTLVVQEATTGRSHWCPNEECPARLPEQLEHYVAKACMDIDGIGPKWCQEVIEAGLINNVADIYRLTASQLQRLPGQGARSAAKAVAGIEASKTRGLQRALYGLNIHRLGRDISAILANNFGSMDEISRLTKSELMSIDTIGETRAECIVEGFKSQRVRTTIELMRAAGVTLENQSNNSDKENDSAMTNNRPWQGIRFVVTGTLPGMNRNQAESAIGDLGGATGSSVSGKTNVLVQGTKTDSASKVTKARSLGTVKIVSGDRFLQALNDPEEFAQSLREAEETALL